MSVPTVVTGDMAPATMKGEITQAWLARARTLRAPSMTPSHTMGELALISEVITQFWSTKSLPKTISAMATESAERSPAVTEAMNGLSEYLMWV